MIISALAFSLLNVFVKYLKDFNIFQIVFFRSLGTLLFTIPLLKTKRIPLLGNKRGLLLARGFIGFLAMLFFFLSLRYLNAGTAVSIRYLSPIIAAFLAIFYLKEKIKPIQWLFFFGAFVGVLILKGFENQFSVLGLIYISISTVLTGFVFVLIRKIKRADHSLVIVNYHMIISLVISGLIAVFYWKQPSFVEFLLLLGLGVFGFFAQYFMTSALQTIDINIITPFKYFEVIFTLGIGVIWLNEEYTLLSLSGILLILVCLTFNALLKKTN